MSLLASGPRRWRGVALVLPFLVLLVAGVLYTNLVQQQADHRWCELIVALDRAYQVTPPTTDLGEQIAAAMHQLADDFDC